MKTFATKRDANKYAFENNLDTNIYPKWDDSLQAWTLVTFAPRIFHTGDQVKIATPSAKWGTDRTLTVVLEKTIDPVISGCPHHRIKTLAANGDCYEGAEYNFVKA
jgi:hypothetical protein